jgi:uncharacterized membrane protein
MKFNWRVELPQLLLIAAMFIAAACAWSHVPDRLPVHWNIHGDVDRWGGKFEGLLAVPLMAIGIYVLLLVVPFFDPGRRNYANFAKAYNAIRIAIVVFLAALYAVLLCNAFGIQANMGTFMLLLMSALFIVLGNYLPKLRPNWFAGVRTPWTLSSQLSWDKTHRLAGWLFIVMGALFGFVAFFQNVWTITAMFVFDAFCILWIVVYSYVVFRNDPQRTPPAGTSPSAE